MLATQGGNRCLLSERVTWGLTGSPLWWSGIGLRILSPALFWTFIHFTGLQSGQQIGKCSELSGEERVCKPTPFFYWRNKVNDSKSSSLYRACNKTVWRMEMALGGIWMNCAINARLLGDCDSGGQCAQLVMRWICAPAWLSPCFSHVSHCKIGSTFKFLLLLPTSECLSMFPLSKGIRKVQGPGKAKINKMSSCSQCVHV